jgi:hypothetical protein
VCSTCTSTCDWHCRYGAAVTHTHENVELHSKGANVCGVVWLLACLQVMAAVVQHTACSTPANDVTHSSDCRSVRHVNVGVYSSAL